MWLLNQFPKDVVQKKYGVKIDDRFLNQLQSATVRFSSGGTGSFVSPAGLLFTNHHVAADCIQKISTSGADYLKNGFLAKRREDERRCPDLEVNVLLKIENVTADVNAGVSAQMPPAEASRVKKAAMSKIEKNCASATGNRCDVVTLYSGAQYHLYQYKKFTDIRLVMSPEFGIAFFGGDPENFTYPRYNLDITFFRAYENGQAAKVERYFKWAKSGVKEGDVVFVPGNPGSTGRLLTVTQLEFSRDVSYELVLRRLTSQIQALERYSAQNEEQRRVAQENVFGLQNSFKAYSGFMRGLRDAALMNQKRAAEKSFRAAIAKDPAQAEKFARFWDELATTYENFRSFYGRYYLLESVATRGSALLEIARDVVRYAEETRKPDGERLRQYTDSALPSLEQTMYSDAPIHPSMEIAVLAEYFQFLQSEFGAQDPLVEQILNGKQPGEAARGFVETSKLHDIGERKRLAKDLDAVRQSQDGMIRLALILDKPARELRKRYEDSVESVVNQAAAQIAQARFALYGGQEYPDATFTMRVAYGDIRGYRDDSGRAVPFATDFAGLFPKGTGKEPYIIPESWLKAKNSLKLNTHFSFVSTADTHGGNSGSPSLNSEGEIVGILFDGNIEGLPNRFVFTDRQARSVHVNSEAVIEALNKIYKASELLKELGF